MLLMGLHQLCILLSSAIYVTMTSSESAGDFFPDIQGNLTRITWAHAVNNQSYLKDVLKNDSVMMIEADISMGKVDGTGDEIPIMAHPPTNSSDLSLKDFMAQIEKSNLQAAKVKGVKLDFKSIEAFNRSVSIISNFNDVNYPVWINADILPGPINSLTVPVNADQFLENAMKFPKSTLSIGWTTELSGDITGSYDDNQINEMINVTKTHKISQPITFPVRAGLAAQSCDLMAKLLDDVDGSTLTIWSSEGDNVDVGDLRKLIARVGINKTYIDVPEDLMSQLHLDDLPKNSASTVALPVSLTLICILVALLC